MAIVEKKNSVLRVVTYNMSDYNIFDIIEEVLKRSNFKIKQIGGGGFYSTEKDKKSGIFVDFEINSNGDFDIEFCEEVISTILKEFKVELI